MTKKRVILVVVFGMLILGVIKGQAIVQHITQVTKKGKAQIATWSFWVNDKQEQVQTIFLQPTKSLETIEKNKIAPGTSGEFQITLQASKVKVGVEYQIEVQEELNKPQNLYFIYEGKKYPSMILLQEQLKGVIEIEEENKVRNIVIQWEWPYETGNTPEEIQKNDAIDQKDGENLQEYSFTIWVTGKQVKPE